MPGSSGKSTRKRGADKRHRLDLKLSDTLADGSLDFYSDRFSLHLDLERSKISGSVIVSGEHHSLKVGMKPNNRWNLVYSHEDRDRAMSVFAEYGRVKKTENLFGITHKDEHHDIKLAYKEKLGIHGHVKGKTRYLNFGLVFTEKKKSSLEIEHVGKRHNVEMKFYPNGAFELRAKVKVRGGEVIVAKRRNRLEAEVSIPF
ncbi:MAG: hypothetical protein GTO51_07955 [Candidatus Latescibacteria bacterium]|nr:hypothetical protein [Candidatus Latescibacterota bacterium]NIM21767.1 hypothetical protein [Candidatus Latescibacterota bacterium]NIM65905.1 hypothetical protein [Candidatus Latescibacterota bacterium]NIO02650.1 hypothetical protein [Candidatus Latescibacterota bacterium]NIO29631.1 hypothetical protein [Candidatus Latescibacterota bacterium]